MVSKKLAQLISETEHLLELRDVPVVGWKTVTELIQWLEDLGYTKLGRGSYTVVYGKDDYVVKVQRPDLRTNNVMLCTIRFHRLAMKSDNPHFPKTYFVKTYEADDSARRYVFGTEKLYPFNGNRLKLPDDKKVAMGMVAFMSDYLGTHVDSIVENTMKLISGYLGPAPMDPYDHANQQAAEFDRYEKLSMAFARSDHPLAIGYEQIRALLEHDQCFMDTVQRNMLMRRDGTLVFADPIADDPDYRI